MEKSRSKKNGGFSLVELLVSVSIFVVIGLVVSTFNRDIFYLNSNIQSSLNAQYYGRKVIRTIIAQLRSASPSSLGAYPISQAATSTLTFYSDVDRDGSKERIRYFLQGTNFKVGITKPIGTPLTYNGAQESVQTLISYVVPTTTPIFDYFAETYAGTTTSLTLPIDVLTVRLIRVTISIDQDLNRAPGPITITTQAMLRNLKGNL